MTNKQSCKRCGAPMESGAALQGMCTRCLMELGMEDDSQVVITGISEAPAPPPSPDELAPLFPGHEILDLLGQGGMGVVYRARQKGLDREVALKILPASAGRDPAFAERFAQEARALARLNHSNITQVFDFGKTGDHYFLAMEFVDGVNLRQLLGTQKVAPKQALQIVEQICDALQYAHDEGVVHRDIKPENILVDRRGRLKITDFGLAKMLGKGDGGMLTRTHQVMGTPHYMAPEQVEAPADVDHRADIFSLGVVFYELLTGELPLGRFAPPSGKVHVNVALDQVVLKALEKEPSLRYQSADAVKTDVTGIDAPEARGRLGRRARREQATAGAGGRRRWGLWAVVGMIVLIGGGLIAVPALLVAIRQRQSEAEMRAMMHAERAQALSEQQFALETLGRLDPFVFNGDRLPEFSPSLTKALNIREEALEALTPELQSAWEHYHRLETASTTYEVLGDGHARVRIESFEPDLTAIAERFGDQLGAQLGPVGLRISGLLVGDLFPHGVEPVTYELRQDGPSAFSYGRSTGDSPPLWTTDSGLPDHLDDYWNKIFRPFAPSSQPAVEAFFASVARIDPEGQRIRVTRVLTKPDVWGVTMEVGVYVVTGDAISASELLESLRDDLVSQGAEVDLSRTNVLGDGSGVEAGRIKVTVDGDRPALAPRGSNEPPTDSTVLLRRLTRDAGMGDIDVSRRTLNSREGYTDVEYSLDPSKEAEAPLATILEWVDRLEGAGEASVVTGIRIWRNGVTPPRDAWQAETSVRVRRFEAEDAGEPR
ncbi:MAG: serine/threonine-protein kinase [Planctomycetota bacterium]